MNSKEIIAEINTELNNLGPGNNNSEILSSIRGITRSLNKLAVMKQESGTRLAKLGADLVQLHSGELLLLKSLNGKEGVKPHSRFSDSFFRSLEVLKEDIRKALKGLSTS